MAHPGLWASGNSRVSAILLQGKLQKLQVQLFLISQKEPIEGGTPTFALRGAATAGHFITFSLGLSVARIDTPPLQFAALVFMSYGFVLVRVRVPTMKTRAR